MNLPEVSAVTGIGKRRFFNAALFLILFAAALLRLINLNQPQLWGDEIGALLANLPATQIIARKWHIQPPETHEPPLMHLLVKLVALPYPHDLGDEAQYTSFFARLPSAVAGLLTVWLIYHLGNLLAERRVGLLAAALMAFLFYPVYYSREARPYALLMLFATVTAVAACKLAKQANWKNVGWLTFSLLGCLYSHYFGAFMLPVVCGWLVLFAFFSIPDHLVADRHAVKRQGLYALLSVGLLYAPWAVSFIHTVKTATTGIQGTSHGQIKALGLDFTYFGELLSRWTFGYGTGSSIWLVVLAAIAFLGIRHRLQSALLPLIWLIIPWLIAIWIPGSSMMHNRYLSFGFPAIVLLLAFGIDAVGVAINAKQQTGARLIVAKAVVFVLVLLCLLPSVFYWKSLLSDHAKCDGFHHYAACDRFIERFSDLDNPQNKGPIPLGSPDTQ